MTTQLTNNKSATLPQEDHHQETILPQEDLRPSTHFQLHLILRATNRPLTEVHQDLYSTDMIVYPFRLLDIYNQVAALESRLSHMTDTVAEIAQQLHDMTH
jgi:hypothetical protein